MTASLFAGSLLRSRVVGGGARPCRTSRCHLIAAARDRVRTKSAESFQHSGKRPELRAAHPKNVSNDHAVYRPEASVRDEADVVWKFGIIGTLLRYAYQRLSDARSR